jgi:SAM-dependent methyltransferase
MSIDASRPAPAAIWHDLECGGYSADLGLWEELARAASIGQRARVLDLGCGTGRVGLHLSALGHSVTGLDLDPDLLDALRERAREGNVDIELVEGDARSFELEDRFDLVLAAMQLAQLFGSSGERMAMLSRSMRHLRPGGVFAAAVLDDLHD